MEEKKLSGDDEKKELSLEKLEKVEKAYLDLMKAYSSCLSILDLKKFYVYGWAGRLKTTYSFRWDNVPGNDGKILRRFLVDYLNIGWAENAEIRKSDDKTILIFKDGNSAKIMIDEKKKKATLNICDGKTFYLNVKKKYGKLNIYPEIKHGAWLDSRKEFYKKRSYSQTIAKLRRLIPYLIVRGEIRRTVAFVRQAFLLLITQSRNKNISEHIKRFEIYCEDMAGLSDQLAKYNLKTLFYPLILAVVPVIASIATNYLGKGTNSLENASNFLEYINIPASLENASNFLEFICVFNVIIIFYLFAYVLFFIVLGFLDSRRLFSETAVPEKESEIFILIQEYLEFE